jgi:hypothetical protein
VNSPAPESKPGAAGGTAAGQPEAKPTPEVLPKDAAGREAESTTQFYIVKSGDTLSSIAQTSYGSAQDWKPILDANAALLNGNERALRAGMKLTIPPSPKAMPNPTATPQAPPAGALPAPARAPTKEIAAEARQRLMRVLEQRLFALALYARMDADTRGKLPALPPEVARLAVPASGDGATQADSTQADIAQARARVSVLIAEDTTNARTLLQSAGFVRASAGTAPNGKIILLGEVPVGRLIDLALLQEVLRVEPQDVKELAPASAR